MSYYRSRPVAIIWVGFPLVIHGGGGGRVGPREPDTIERGRISDEETEAFHRQWRESMEEAKAKREAKKRRRRGL